MSVRKVNKYGVVAESPTYTSLYREGEVVWEGEISSDLLCELLSVLGFGVVICSHCESFME